MIATFEAFKDHCSGQGITVTPEFRPDVTRTPYAPNSLLAAIAKAYRLFQSLRNTPPVVEGALPIHTSPGTHGVAAATLGKLLNIHAGYAEPQLQPHVAHGYGVTPTCAKAEMHFENWHNTLIHPEAYPGALNYAGGAILIDHNGPVLAVKGGSFNTALVLREFTVGSVPVVPGLVGHMRTAHLQQGFGAYVGPYNTRIAPISLMDDFTPHRLTPLALPVSERAAMFNMDVERVFESLGCDNFVRHATIGKYTARLNQYVATQGVHVDANGRFITPNQSEYP